MQIYEVKNNIAEILYAPDENHLFLSDFLFIEDNDSTIVSQVTNIATTEQADINIATVKFYLTVDKDNRLRKYDGHTPSKNAEVGYLDAEEIVGLFKPKSNELVWGSYVRNNQLPIATDLKFLSANCCILSDKAEQSTTLLNKLIASLDKAKARVLILDFDGKYKSITTTQSACFGNDFRIPLGSMALDYIFENDLNDCPLEAKAVIQNIILEIQQYVESIPQGFIPFNQFINIVMGLCKNTSNSGLTIFCNKLLQYKQKKIFADTESQFAQINSFSGSYNLNLSNIDTKYHNLILNSINSFIKQKCYIFADISEENANTDTIKRIYENKTIRIIPIVSHSDKYTSKVKSFCKNFVIFAPTDKIQSGEVYSDIIEKPNEFILCGESTIFIPLAVTLSKETLSSQEKAIIDAITEEDLDNLDLLNAGYFNKEFEEKEPNSDDITEDDLNELDDNAQITNLSENQEDFDTSESQEQETIEENIEDSSKNELNQQEATDSSDTENNTDDSEEIADNTKTDNNELSTEEVVIQDEEENNDTETQTADQQEQPVISSSTEEPVAEQPDETIQEEQQVVPNNTAIQNQQQELPKPIRNRREIPNAEELPLYEPKETNESNSQTFQEGNRVMHAKYGEGTVEKIIIYGKKTLCSIQFDNFGRRLLDPNITTINKI